jgi:integrase
MMAKHKEFPITVRRGSSVVKIYRDQTKASGTYFRVCYYVGAKRHRLNFASLDDAKLEAETRAAQLSRGDADALQLTGKDRLIYCRAAETVRPHGIALDTAAQEYSDAKKVLDGFSLLDAARFYVKHHGRKFPPKRVSEAVEEMIAAKGKKGLSVTYLADLRYRLGSFADAFACNMGAITPDDVRSYLDGLNLAPRGYNNFLAALRTFFSFGSQRGWLAAETNMLRGVEKRKERAVPVQILTPSEMVDLLKTASDELRLCLAVAAFAGLRSEEVLRLEWADIERRPGFIEVSAAKAKTASRRLVPIAPNLAAWLANAPRSASGKIWPHSKPYFFRAIHRTVTRLNKGRSDRAGRFSWKTNAMRHSYVSYRLAEIQDMNRVALEAGNSPKMILQHYRELCTPEDAKTWFSLVPGDRGHVIQFKKSA